MSAGNWYFISFSCDGLDLWVEKSLCVASSVVIYTLYSLFPSLSYVCTLFFILFFLPPLTSIPSTFYLTLFSLPTLGFLIINFQSLALPSYLFHLFFWPAQLPNSLSLPTSTQSFPRDLQDSPQLIRTSPRLPGRRDCHPGGKGQQGDNECCGGNMASGRNKLCQLKEY